MISKTNLYLYLFIFIFGFSSIQAGPFSDFQGTTLKFKKLTSNEGLSQNFISDIYQDKYGFIWIGTKDGLNRYDGYEFKVYRHNPFDTTSLSGNFIHTIFEDSKGKLWVGSNSLDLFIPENNAFKRIDLNLRNSSADPTRSNKINSITEDLNGYLWLGTDDGLIRYEPQSGTSRLFYQQQERGTSLSDNLILSLATDDSLIIIGTQNGMKLLNIKKVTADSATFTRISHLPASELITSKRTILTQFRYSSQIIYAGTPSGLIKINLSTRESEFIPYRGHTFFPFWHNRILSIVQDKNGNLWFACSGGLVIYNPISGYFRYCFHDPKDDQSLSLNNITSLFTDRGGKIWIGTAGKGIDLFDQNKKEFSLYNGLVDREPFKTSFSVSAILAENDSFLWIASQQKLFRLDRVTGEYKYINLLYGPEGEITSLVKDKNQNIWVSSSGGLYKISDSGKKITRYSHDPSNANSLKDDFVRLLFIDSKGNLFALNSRYISKLNEDSNSFTHFELKFADQTDITPIIRSIYETVDGSFWFGWYEGLVKYNPQTEETIVYKHQAGNNNSISNNEILTICEDPVQPQKYLWVGTQGGGLSRLNLEENSFNNFSVSDGLPNNVIYGVLSSGNEIWLSTNNGLCRVTTDKYGTPTFRNYDVSDGLQGNEFNTGAYSKSSSGELFFGGLNGVNAFFPSDIRDNIYIPPVVFTELKFLKESYSADDVVKNQVSEAIINSKITIPYSQNSFTIQFSSLDYTATEKNRYMYKLIPIHNEWINLGTQRNVTFTQLGTGSYELIVKGSNNDGIWNEEGAKLSIVITPPYWQTAWAYAIYSVLIIIILYMVRRYELSRLRLKNRLKIESFETQKLKELDEMKSGFFANISHEFRTPLTLILGPAEQLEQNETDDNKKEKIHTIKSSAKRLLKLINQILDLSKLEKGKTRLRCEEGDLVIFLKGITNSFSSIAERKKISLHFVSDASEIQTYFDRDVFEKIFYNLLSNAFKFTAQGGSVEVKINKLESISNPTASDFCKISVKDTGIGIKEDDLPKVFNKFFTVENINGFTEQGSGIGLALVKELVELHKGYIIVESKINSGSIFTVTIPLGKDFLSEDEIAGETISNKLISERNINELIDEEVIEFNTENNKEFNSQPEDSLIVLLVEDNPDLRKYIGVHLETDYKIIEAATGKEGCEKAVEIIPDLIISDIMMPEMDGYSLCKKLKSDERTSHIPIILLTARAGEEDKLHGLETGADDYLTKPFSSKELLLRVNNLIEVRQILRKKFSGSLIIKPKDIAGSSVDKLFLEKAIRVVENNISNEKFSVEEFSEEMNLSHSQLHRKLKALINQSSIQFIRSIRMQRALELLQHNSGNIAEIAWQVGFTDPSYFTKTFSKHFGYLPSDVNK